MSTAIELDLVKKRTRQQKLIWMRNHWQLYLLVLVPIVWVVIFRYVPMYGITIAFKNYRIKEGMLKSPWADPLFKHFQLFFSSPLVGKLIINTLVLSFYSTIAGFVPPILLAVFLNECRSSRYKRFVQMITYAPHFISMVLIIGILAQIMSLRGVVNNVLDAMGLDRISFFGRPDLFRHLYVWSGVWQNVGYSAIIYIAVLAGVNPELYEAATIDGASIWQRIWHVDVPSIMPTATILLILASARVLNVGFEKVFLMQNAMNLGTSEIIATFVYKVGLRQMQYSYSTAVGLFQSVVSLVLLTVVNWIARRVGETSLW